MYYTKGILLITIWWKWQKTLRVLSGYSKKKCQITSLFLFPPWVVISSHVYMSCLSCICLCSHHNRHTKIYFLLGHYICLTDTANVEYQITVTPFVSKYCVEACICFILVLFWSYVPLFAIKYQFLMFPFNNLTSL